MYENPNNEKVRYDPQTGRDSCWRRPAGRTATRRAGWSKSGTAADDRDRSTPIRQSERFFTDLSGGPAEGRHHAQPALRHASKRWSSCSTNGRSAWSSIAYGGAALPAARSRTGIRRWPTQKNTNNITGFKNARADEIIDAYDKEFDLQQARRSCCAELDGIVTSEHHWILEWTRPYERIVYWNKFGQPDGRTSRAIGDYRDIPSLWWIDPQKNAQLEQAMRDPSVKLDVGDERRPLLAGVREGRGARADGTQPGNR